MERNYFVIDGYKDLYYSFQQGGLQKCLRAVTENRRASFESNSSFSISGEYFLRLMSLCLQSILVGVDAHICIKKLAFALEASCICLARFYLLGAGFRFFVVV